MNRLFQHGNSTFARLLLFSLVLTTCLVTVVWGISRIAIVNTTAEANAKALVAKFYLVEQKMMANQQLPDIPFEHKFSRRLPSDGAMIWFKTGSEQTP